jgi:hypothetical protein
VGLSGIALVHLLDLQSKWHETTYLAVLYVVLIAACVAASALLLTRMVRAAWLLTAACALAPLAAYCLSRTVGLPSATADTGNWLEPLGLASLYVEGVVLILGGAASAAFSNSKSHLSPVAVQTASPQQREMVAR